MQRSAGRRTGAAFTALPETRPKQERIDDAENSNRNGCILGHVTPKKGTKPLQWLAQHEDIHFDCFNKLCFALNHNVDEHFSHAKLFGKEPLNVQMYYQILVLAGEIVDVFPTKKEVKLRSARHIHYVQSYVTGGREQQYHIDVVTEKYLPRLLRLIDVEAKKTVQLIKRHRIVVQASIDQITASVRRIRSPKAIQARLEL